MKSKKIETQGIHYFGSKRDIIPEILFQIDNFIGMHNIGSVFDGFSGTTRVSQAFKKSGFIVAANDKSEWSKVFGMCYLLNKNPKEYYEELISHLNNLEGRAGWFTSIYGGINNKGLSIQPDNRKAIWQLHNAIKVDAIRDEIDKLSLDKVEKSVLLSSLMLAMDKVANVMGHFNGSPDKWQTRSFPTMFLEIPSFEIDDLPHQVFQEDTVDLAEKISVDLAYYDPPYGFTDFLEEETVSCSYYTSYYHIWKTICLWDKPAVTGRAHIRKDATDYSIFETNKKSVSGDNVALKALEKIFEVTDAPYIVLSYNNQKDILPIAEKLGLKVLYGHKPEHIIGMSLNQKKRMTSELMSQQMNEYIFIFEKR